MKYFIKYFVAFFLFLFTASCNFTYKIPIKDYSLIPYKGNEVLAFRSNTAETDTVFLTGINHFFSPKDQWAFPLKDAEHYQIMSKRTDPVYSERRLPGELITLIYDGVTTISIEFTVKNAWFYGPYFYTKSEFLKFKTIALRINNKVYDDVVVLNPNEVYKENVNGKVVERSDTITKLYWSRKYGIIRYDKIGTEFWELVSINRE